jgi:putative chitinase
VAARSAAFFWKSHGLNELADDRSGDDDNADFQLITIRINGGTNGLDGRRAYWAQAKKALGVA